MMHQGLVPVFLDALISTTLLATKSQQFENRIYIRNEGEAVLVNSRTNLYLTLQASY
jgi:hypothetical protein